MARAPGRLVPALPGGTSPAEALAGGIGDAVSFLKEVRNIAAHPGRAVTGAALPGFDFTDTKQMHTVYEVLQRIADAVFDKLAEPILALPYPA